MFAGLYLLGGDCIAGARPGSFADAFHFSVQTLATIGYGAWSPSTRWAHNVVFVESFAGLLATAVTTGIFFAKFSKPQARVLFSDRLLLTRHDGAPVLMLRLGNARTSSIVEASVSLVVTLGTVTAEGQRLRKLVDLELVRKTTPIFGLTWTVIHRVDERSALFGLDPAALQAMSATFIVTVSGLEAGIAQTVHARRVYEATALLADHTFEDVLDFEGGVPTLDYRKFQQVKPVGR